jgi:hypothetical protein
LKEEEAMNLLSKLMATTAALTLAGGAALAQTAQTQTGAGVGVGTGGAVEAAATGGVTGQTGVPLEPSTQLDRVPVGVTGQAGATGTATGTTGVPLTGTTAQTGVTGQTGVAAQPTAPMQPGVAAQAGATAGVGATHGFDTFTQWNQRLERGERVDVVTMDGIPLGHVAQPGTFDERGASQFSITLAPELALGAERVTFIGTADLDADGRIVLPMGQQDITASIQSQIADPG